MSLPRIVIGIVMALAIIAVAAAAGWWFFVREDNELATSAPEIPSDLVDSETPGATPASGDGSGLTFVIIADRSEAAYFADEELASVGLPAAQLVGVGIGDGGVILAQYSNGQQSVIGQLAMASIRNPESLIAVGNNNYQLSARSALPAVGVPGTGGRGTILGGAVENSTVDIAREFTNLIVLQRGYQANARVVTTVDELSQETINLKR